MVMHRLRAASYLRRTISEPFPGKRLSAVVSQIPDDRQYSKYSGGVSGLDANLIRKDPSIAPIGEDVSPTYTWATDFLGLKALLLNWLNIGLIFVPLGFSASCLDWGSSWVFWFNFAALIPLAAILGHITEELALHTGDLIGGLLNATFGNAVEMILTVQSLRAGLLTVVQGTLLGSILSNLLLVLGMSFFAGGLFHHVQKFNQQGAACSTSLLMLACLAFIVPTVVRDSDTKNDEAVLQVSRLTAVLIGLTYFLYLFFQLYTHLSLFKDNHNANSSIADSSEDVIDNISIEDEGWPTISWLSCVILLFSITLLISFQSECLVGSIEGLSRNSHIPESFIGVILLPIVGNAAEHATAVTVAIKNKPDLTMGVAVGSSTQIAMFMVPFAVLSGWIMNIPMTLAFSNISVVVLAFSILITIGVVQDGESNWLEGVMLMAAYAIVAIVFWFDKSTSFA